ncbi:MinD/ParA family protein [Fonticella tunisiensis]|uniref:Flagellar biosynthesis protein FlhG n=1 Tax=Fonticella tunisiensis TaxID=1096341 RepID=A0A4R7K992_9CLOT|nr:MinD/ParA family protein [Fonticella tunisiensis]TDT50594.1 flagellar biosynthesis protein FlhG [Fonticella tunisiensis]
MDQAEKLRQLVNIKNGKNYKFRVITVSSGKGGVGKTNLVINLASSLKKRGMKVAVLDADFGMANVDILYGINAEYSIYDILHNNKEINEVMVLTDDGIVVIPGGSGIKELSELDADMRKKLIKEFEKLHDIDILLVDTGAGMSSTVLNFIEVADVVVIVTNSEPTALTDAYSLIKVVLKGNINSNINVVINRARNIKDARDTFDKLKRTVDAFIGREIKYLGYIPDDQKVGQAVREQKPFIITYPRCEASICIHKISSELLGKSSSQKSSSMKDYFSRLLRIMGR